MIQVTEYCKFARLGSGGWGAVLYIRPSFGNVAANFAKHRNLCVAQTCSVDTAGKQSKLSPRNLGFC